MKCKHILFERPLYVCLHSLRSLWQIHALNCLYKLLIAFQQPCCHEDVTFLILTHLGSISEWMCVCLRLQSWSINMHSFLSVLRALRRVSNFF